MKLDGASVTPNLEDFARLSRILVVAGPAFPRRHPSQSTRLHKQNTRHVLFSPRFSQDMDIDLELGPSRPSLHSS
jgi:hypothetical protein